MSVHVFYGILEILCLEMIDEGWGDESELYGFAEVE